MSDLYSACVQCPRKCGTDRAGGRTGFCGEKEKIRAAVACLHFGEEPLITVNGGSGTIFVTGCNLRCAFCQNYQISQGGYGSELSAGEFADLCLKLQDAGAENINIVTGSHSVPEIAAALEIAKNRGLVLPVCWNSSAYETEESLELLKGLVDIWLPDLKTLNPLIANRVFKAKDYPVAAKRAIRWMLSNTERKIVSAGEREKMLSGVIIRHLVLPGRLDDTRLVLDWLKAHADTGDDHGACISLMSQYTPVTVERTLNAEKGIVFSEESLASRSEALNAFSNRLLTKQEFAQIRELIDSYEFEYLFYQELEEDTEWLPDFTRSQPFSNALAKVVWHC